MPRCIFKVSQDHSSIWNTLLCYEINDIVNISSFGCLFSDLLINDQVKNIKCMWFLEKLQFSKLHNVPRSPSIYSESQSSRRPYNTFTFLFIGPLHPSAFHPPPYTAHLWAKVIVLTWDLAVFLSRNPDNLVTLASFRICFTKWQCNN